MSKLVLVAMVVLLALGGWAAAESVSSVKASMAANHVRNG